MSTPGSSNTPSASSPIDQSQDEQQFSKEDAAVLEYLRKRGLKSAEQELRDSIAAAGADVRPANEGRTTRSRAAKSKTNTTVTAAELVKKNAPTLARTADAPNVLADPNVAKQVATTVVNNILGSNLGASNLSNLLSAVGMGVEDALATAPTDRHDGFRELEAWVDGSLDMYRVRLIWLKLRVFLDMLNIVQPEFRPILFPIFCHFYLDLVEQGLKDAGQSAPAFPAFICLMHASQLLTFSEHSRHP